MDDYTEVIRYEDGSPVRWEDGSIMEWEYA